MKLMFLAWIGETRTERRESRGEGREKRNETRETRCLFQWGLFFLKDFERWEKIGEIRIERQEPRCIVLMG